MYCQECGTQIEVDSRFCRNCGTSVAAAPSAATDQEDAVGEQPVFEEASPHGATTEPTGDHQRALELVRQAVQADMNGRLETAATLAEDAVRADPADARARSCLAGIYERLGRSADAVIQYEAAVALDPSNQLDRLRLRRLAPDREAAVHASSPQRRTALRWPVVVAAAAAFVIVTGTGLVGYFTLLKPKIAASRELAMNVSEDDAAILLSRARGDYRLMRDYDGAEALLWQVLEQDPNNTEAQQLLAEVLAAKGSSGATPTAAENPDTRIETVFPSDETQALGAVIGVRDSLQPSLPVSPALPLPGAAQGGMPGAGIPTPLGSPLTGPALPGGVYPSDAPPYTITSGNREPSLDNPLGNPGGGLMSRAGGVGNAAVWPGPLSGLGAPRRPGIDSGPGGRMRPSPPGYNVFNDSGNQGPIFPIAPSGGGGDVPSVRRAEGGSPPIRISAGSRGGSVRSPGPGTSGGGSVEAPEDRGSRLQAEGLRLADLGDSAGAIRALQQAQAEFQRSSNPAAGLSAKNCDREIGRLQGR